jgi:hypothetical protein
MTTSLKGFLPDIGRILGVSTDALYERQRALVREGLFDSAPGRGPGSGVVATADSVALLLIGFLASFSLAEAGPRARVVAMAEPSPKSKKCPLTGMTTFKDALAKILSDEKLSNRVQSIRVAGTHAHTEIHFRNKNRVEESSFDGDVPEKPGLRFDITIDSVGVHALAERVCELLATQAASP